MKIVTFLADAVLLIIGAFETVNNKVKKQKRGVTRVPVTSATLAVCLLENMLTGKVVIITGEGTIRTRKNI